MTTEDSAQIVLDKCQTADLIADVWRIQKRANRDGGESVMLACERAFDRLNDMGFSIDEMVDTAYHANMRVNVKGQDGRDKNQIISVCLSPAIYFRATENQAPELIKRAEVLLKGGV